MEFVLLAGLTMGMLSVGVIAKRSQQAKPSCEGSRCRNWRVRRQRIPMFIPHQGDMGVQNVLRPENA